MFFGGSLDDELFSSGINSLALENARTILLSPKSFLLSGEIFFLLEHPHVGEILWQCCSWSTHWEKFWKMLFNFA